MGTQSMKKEESLMSKQSYLQNALSLFTGESKHDIQAGFMSDPPQWFQNIVGGNTSLSGQYVSPQNALQIAAVLSCVRLIAESIASLPLNVYRKSGDGNRDMAQDHFLFPVLHSLANPESTSFTLRESLMLHLLLRGNAYAEKIFDRGGRLRQLWLHRSENVEMERNKETNLIQYKITEVDEFTGQRKGEGTPRTLLKEQMWHIAGLSWNGVEGLSPIGLARESLGLSLSQEEYGSMVFKQGARLGGTLNHPGKLTNEGRENLSKSWQDQYGGSANAHKTAILEEGIEFKPIAMTNSDAEFLESRKFTITEIARIFRVPLHMIYFAENQPRANMEQLNIEYVNYTLRPWLVRIEQSALLNLVPESERGVIFVEHNVDGLLRGDFNSRMKGYATGRQWGWWSVNDIRQKENLNPIGEEGDRYLEPLNLGTPEEKELEVIENELQPI